MYYKTYYDSPVGQLLLVADESALIGLWINGQKYFLGNLKQEPVLCENNEILLKTIAWLSRYFHKESVHSDELPLSPIGSSFQRQIWKKLCDIPYGQVMTYGQIANQIAFAMGKSSMSAQAVGNAVGHNPISIIIPCHRVIGSNGSLTGYAGGLDKKRMLLQHEEVDMSDLWIPKKE